MDGERSAQEDVLIERAGQAGSCGRLMSSAGSGNSMQHVGAHLGMGGGNAAAAQCATAGHSSPPQKTSRMCRTWHMK